MTNGLTAHVVTAGAKGCVVFADGQVTNYRGTVHLSSDGNDALFSPNAYTFTADDAGQRVFRVAFQHSGTHFIRAVDAAIASLFGEEDDIVVV